MKYMCLFVWLVILCKLHAIDSRIHNFSIQNDVRRQIQLSSFGFLKGGNLIVNINDFSTSNTKLNEALRVS